MDSAGGYEPKRTQTVEEKIEEWNTQASILLSLDSEQNDGLYGELLQIFSDRNFDDSSGQQALRDIEKLKDQKRDPESIISFLKDKFKYQHNI